MSAQQFALIGNGPFVPAFALMNDYTGVVALDGGYKHCTQLGITPLITLGDGDSIANDTAYLSIPDQTTTDLQKGLAWLAEHYAQPYTVDLLSVTSAERLDHTLSAIQLASLHPEIRYLYTPYQRLQIVRDQLALDLPADLPFSIVPVAGTTATVAITGCCWNGNDLVLDGQSSGISNETTEEPLLITVRSGSVLVILQQLWTKQ